jgi:hypothetical protein
MSSRCTRSVPSAAYSSASVRNHCCISGRRKKVALLVVAGLDLREEVLDALRRVGRRVGVDLERPGVTGELARLACQLVAHPAGQAREVRVEPAGEVDLWADGLDVVLDDAEPVTLGRVGDQRVPAGVRREPTEHHLVPAAVGHERRDVRVGDVGTVLRVPRGVPR